jgi:hypothetical protein
MQTWAGVMWRLAKSVLAGVAVLAAAAFAYGPWLLHVIASLGGYWEFDPDKPRLTVVALLVFASRFFWQWRRSKRVGLEAKFPRP